MPSESRPLHLRFINPQQEATGHKNFPQFNKLPVELRLEIWKFSICHERLIRVRLAEKRPGDSINESVQQRREPRGHLMSEEFVVIMEQGQDISKLFSICCESRQAAKLFYRVQVPCIYHRDGASAPPLRGIFYFNPELDIISFPGLMNNHLGHGKYLPGFAQMLRDNDPQHIGLANLAMTTTTFYWYRGCRKFFEPDDEHVVREFLSKLRRVIFGFHGSCIGRIWLETQPWGSFGYSHITRSRPLLASVSKFQRLPEDPRPIVPELKRVRFPFGDPRDQMYRWFRLLEKWKIRYDWSMEYKFMLTFDTPRVRNSHHAYLELKKEHKRWEAWQKKSIVHKYRVGCEDNLEQAIPSAYGFWLFPIDAFGPIPNPSGPLRMCSRARLRDCGRIPQVWEYSKPWDLSSSKPELCLQHLPTTEKPLEKKWKLSRGKREIEQYLFST